MEIKNSHFEVRKKIIEIKEIFMKNNEVESDILKGLDILLETIADIEHTKNLSSHKWRNLFEIHLLINKVIKNIK